MESRWFAGADDLDGSKLFNSHSTYDEATKRWKVDSFLAMLPRSQYQADPREVAWHYFTVNRLREQGMPIEERVKTMNSVAKLKPWLHGDERKQLEK